MLKEKLCLTPFSCPPFLFSLHRLSRVMESRTSEICFASLCHSILVMQFSILSHWLLFLLPFKSAHSYMERSSWTALRISPMVISDDFFARTYPPPGPRILFTSLALLNFTKRCYTLWRELHCS